MLMVENHQEQNEHKYYNYIKCKKQRVTVAFVRLFIFGGSILWKMRRDKKASEQGDLAPTGPPCRGGRICNLHDSAGGSPHGGFRASNFRPKPGGLRSAALYGIPYKRCGSNLTLETTNRAGLFLIPRAGRLPRRKIPAPCNSRRCAGAFRRRPRTRTAPRRFPPPPEG